MNTSLLSIFALMVLSYSQSRLLFCILGLFLFLSFPSVANTHKRYDNILPKFQKFDLKDGLSNLNISSIIQDDNGYMWFATARGVNRFDGVTFKQFIFCENDSSQLSILGASHKNYEGNLFFDSQLGISMYDVEEEKMIHLNSKHGNIYAFIDYDSITYAVSSRSGFCVYNPNNKTFNRLHYYNNDLLINQLIIDSVSGIWGKSVDNMHISNLNPKANELVQYDIPIEYGISKSASMVIIDSVIVLIGEHPAVFNLRTKQFSQLPNHWDMLKQLEDQEVFFSEMIYGSIYIGTRRNGLYIFNPNKNTLINLNKSNSSISSNFVRSIYKDRDENLWLGTFDRGINLASMNLRSLNFDRTLNALTNDKFITNITSDSAGIYYISTRNYGLLVYNSIQKTSKYYNTENSFLTSNYVLKVFIDSQKRLWISDAQALHLTDLSSRKSKIVYSDLIDGFNEICEHNDKIIASSGNGFYIFDLSGKLIKHEKRLGLNISQVLPLNDEEIIVASYIEGVSIYNLNTSEYRHIDKRNKEENTQTITIYLENENVLWSGRYGLGLQRIDIKNLKYTNFRMDDGLPNNDIVGIAEDKNGYLWLSTSYGLSRFDKNKEFVNFYYSEGLNNLQFHSKSVHSDKNNIIYFSGNNGLSYFDPIVLSNSMNQKTHQIILETLTIQNKVILPNDDTGILSKTLNKTSSLELKHDQNSFSIEYQSFNYTSAKSILYEYSLEGLNDLWYKAGNHNVANFSNLKPGQYIFKVRAKSEEGQWSVSHPLYIDIKPSPFKTAWAYIFYLLVLITIIYTTFQLKLRAGLYKSKLELEHQERIRESEISQMKMRFFTNISHEIRTPLTLIKGNADLLSKELIEKNTSSPYLNSLLYSTNRLLSLVNQLLSVRKLENDALDLQIKNGDIIQITNRIIQPFIHSSSSRKISISIISDFAQLTMPIDEDKYEKILSNLISNAIKHVSKYGIIQIKIEALKESDRERFFNKTIDSNHQNYLRISVVDNGEGISQEEIGHIFDRFSRSSSDSKKPDYSGTGIGLDFTRRLVELHKGTIIATSEKNNATSFSFVLPLDEVCYKDEEWIIEDKKQVIKPIETKVVEVKENVNDTTTEKDHILLIEDDLELNSFLTSILKKHYKVISSFNGEEGLQKARELFPKVIISDIMMPRMDGFELCNIIRNDELISHLPIILLTAKTDIKSKVQGYKYGADDYISKPFNHEVLLARINNLILSREKLQSLYRQGILEINSKEDKNPFELSFINKLEAILSEEYHSPLLSVNFLADKMNMSRTNFYRKFMNIIDISPKSFITKYRINKSIELIRNGNDNLGEISYLCGFSSQSNYTATFKKEKGITPLQFKKNLGPQT